MRILGRSMMVALMMGLLLSTAMVGEAWAQGLPPCTSADAASCAPKGFSTACTPDTDGHYYICTPEMSDYLAMAFVAVAGGMIFHFRRRALARA